MLGGGWRDHLGPYVRRGAHRVSWLVACGVLRTEASQGRRGWLGRPSDSIEFQVLVHVHLGSLVESHGYTGFTDVSRA